MLTHHRPHFQTSLAKFLGMAFAGLAFVAAPLAVATVAHAGNSWEAIDRTVFDNRPVKQEDGVVALDVPVQVQDASLVPITVRIPPEIKEPLKSLTIVIDDNPMPVVARIQFGPAQGSGGERRFSTRVRVDNFSHIRAVAETQDGVLHMTTKFIAGTGGCSAMNGKDPTTADSGMGKMVVKTFPPALDETPTFEGLVMIKHPNSSGQQVDPNTGKFISARFVQHVVVKRDGVLVFDMNAGPSVSENPYFRFTFARGKTNNLTADVTDSDHASWSDKSAPSGS
jgi:sulfur-oxidizing protein SoxY